MIYILLCTCYLTCYSCCCCCCGRFFFVDSIIWYEMRRVDMRRTAVLDSAIQFYLIGLVSTSPSSSHLALKSFYASLFLDIILFLFICLEWREHSEEKRTLTLSGQRTKFLKLLLLLFYFFVLFCFWTLFLLQCKHQPWNLLKCWPAYFKSSAPLNALTSTVDFSTCFFLTVFYQGWMWNTK